MIELNQHIETLFNCPDCNVRLKSHGWYMPGMRMLADLACPKCNKEYYGDLPAGHGLYYPILLEKKTGNVHSNYGVIWFAEWLKKSYQNRTTDKVTIHKESIKPIKCPVILNCLDGLYGHSLLKLLNAQYYLEKHPDKDLIVIVPQFLRWMVPEGVASIWTVDITLKQGREWHDSIAEVIKEYFQDYDYCYLSIALSHPDPSDIDIKRFISIEPFKIEKWHEKFSGPRITFIWRDDRLWNNFYDSYVGKLFKKLNLYKLFRINSIDKQRTNIIHFATNLLDTYPDLNFSITGIGKSGDFPSWISDLRVGNIDESIEKKWCERYAKSHIVIGVHGSNMLLPSALAGATIELVPDDRWGNLLQDFLLPNNDIRISISKIRFLNVQTSPKELATSVKNLIQYMPIAVRNFSEKYTDHKNIMSSPHSLSKTILYSTEQIQIE